MLHHQHHHHRKTLTTAKVKVLHRGSGYEGDDDGFSTIIEVVSLRVVVIAVVVAFAVCIWLLA